MRIRESSAFLTQGLPLAALVTLVSVGGCRSPETLSQHVADTIGDGATHSPSGPKDGVEGVIQCSDTEGADGSLANLLSHAWLSEPDDVSAMQAAITLEDLQAIAMQSHPAIRRQRAAVDAARGQAVQAGLPFNPIFQYQSDEVGNERSSGLHSWGVSQQVVTANKLGIAQQVECREVRKQQARLRVEELRVLARVRLAFNRVLVAQQRRDLTDQIFRVAEKSVSAVNGLVQAGEASRLALLQMRVQAEQARIEANNAETNYQAGVRILSAAVGDPGVMVDSLEGDLAASLRDRPWDTLVDELLTTSPEMSFAGSELQRARCALQLAYAQVVPNVTGRAGVGYDAFTGDAFARVGVSVPLPIRNRNQGNIRSARANIVEAANAIESTELSLATRLAGAVGRFEVARERHDRLKASVVPDAEEAYELASQAYQVGEADYLQLLTAQRALFSTRLSVLDALGQAADAAAEIDTALVGLPFQ